METNGSEQPNSLCSFCPCFYYTYKSRKFGYFDAKRKSPDSPEPRTFHFRVITLNTMKNTFPLIEAQQ